MHGLGLEVWSFSITHFCLPLEITFKFKVSSIVVHTVKTWMANFVRGIITSFIQQQVFLRSMAPTHLDKDGIYVQLRKKTQFSMMAWLCYRFYSHQALKHAIVEILLCYYVLLLLDFREIWNHISPYNYGIYIFYNLVSLIVEIMGAAYLPVWLIHECMFMVNWNSVQAAW